MKSFLKYKFTETESWADFESLKLHLFISNSANTIFKAAGKYNFFWV